jgi:myo-inositol 2-dehydrogenase / D-chiro-inositol 1-dehydrogenase
MRLGLIGLGRIGAFHADTLTSLDAVDELVVTDAVPAAIDRIVEKYGATPAATPADLLTSGVDGVVIAAATDAHPQLILAAVEAGLPVFCEKPVAKGAAEAAEVLRHCAGATVQIGYNRRFDTGFAAARKAVREGELGWLHTVRSTTMDPAPPPDGYIASSGGIFRDCSVHDFDIIRFVTGREVVEVYGRELAAFTEVVAGTRESPCTVADAVEAGWIAEACTRSMHEHRPIRMTEVRAT